jgi:hypothetical protein
MSTIWNEIGIFIPLPVSKLIDQYLAICFDIDDLVIASRMENDFDKYYEKFGEYKTTFIIQYRICIDYSSIDHSKIDEQEKKIFKSDDLITSIDDLIEINKIMIKYLNYKQDNMHTSKVFLHDNDCIKRLMDNLKCLIRNCKTSDYELFIRYLGNIVRDNIREISRELKSVDDEASDLLEFYGYEISFDIDKRTYKKTYKKERRKKHKSSKNYCHVIGGSIISKSKKRSKYF